MKGKLKIQLALWTLLFMVAIPISAYGVDGQIKIAQTAGTTFPITINESGSYVLTSNLTVTTANVNAININADNVTLDLNGHCIYGPGTGTGNGISAVDRYNITIKNGIVGGFYFGIYLYNDADHQGAGHRIEGIQASNNGSDGINANYSTVTNCTANNNGSYGIYAYYSTVTNCTANNNGSDGIYASKSTVKGCNVRYNTGWGIYMGTNYHNYIYRNAASGNTAGQIYCPSGNTCVDNATF